MDFLGHIIISKGISVDPKKFWAFQDWPVPTIVKDVYAFLRLAKYYHKFIRGFGTIVTPLTHLSSKDGFYWNFETRKIFLQLKMVLTIALIIQLVDFSQKVNSGV